MRHVAILFAAGVTLGCIACVLVTEGLGTTSFGSGAADTAASVVATAVVGALQGALFSRLGVARGTSAWRLAAVAAGFAGLTALLLARLLTAWTVLSVFGSGPGGRLVAIVFPVSQGIAGAVLGSYRVLDATAPGRSREP